MDSQLVWPPVSRYGFRIEDTGHMYVIRTPSHILIQWLHSSGLMILEANKASETQGRGLCGEVGPSLGRGTQVPLYQGELGQSAQPERRTSRAVRAGRPNVLCSGAKAARREMVQGSGFGQLSLQPGLSVSFR